MTMCDQVRFLVVANAVLTFELDAQCAALGFSDYKIRTVRCQIGPVSGESTGHLLAETFPAAIGRIGFSRRLVKALERNSAWWWLRHINGESIHTLEQATPLGPGERHKDVRACIHMIDRILRGGMTNPGPWVEIRTSVGPAIATRPQFYSWLASVWSRANEKCPACSTRWSTTSDGLVCPRCVAEAVQWPMS